MVRTFVGPVFMGSGSAPLGIPE